VHQCVSTFFSIHETLKAHFPGLRVTVARQSWCRSVNRDFTTCLTPCHQSAHGPSADAGARCTMTPECQLKRHEVSPLAILSVTACDMPVSPVAVGKRHEAYLKLGHPSV